MNDEPRQKLREIVVKYSTSICKDKQKCKGLILDYCSNHRKEANLFIVMLDENVPVDLLNGTVHVSTEIVIPRLVQKVCDERSLEKAAAQWAIEAWAFALGLKVTRSSQKRPEPLPPVSTKSVPTRPIERAFTPAPQTRAQISPTPQVQVQRTPAPQTQAQTSPTPQVQVQPAPSTTSSSNRASPATPRPVSVPRSRQTSGVRAPRRRSSTLTNLFLIAFSVLAMILSARTVISFHVLSPSRGYTLFPYILYILAAMLGHKRGLLAGLLFVGLEYTKLSFLVFNPASPQFISGFLGFYPDRGSAVGFYYGVSLIILFTLGWLCQGRRPFFLQTLGIVILGQCIYDVYIIAIDVFYWHSTLSKAFTFLNPLVYDVFLLLFIITIPVNIIRVQRTKKRRYKSLF